MRPSILIKGNSDKTPVCVKHALLQHYHHELLSQRDSYRYEYDSDLDNLSLL